MSSALAREGFSENKRSWMKKTWRVQARGVQSLRRGREEEQKWDVWTMEVSSKDETLKFKMGAAFLGNGEISFSGMSSLTLGPARKEDAILHWLRGSTCQASITWNSANIQKVSKKCLWAAGKIDENLCTNLILFIRSQLLSPKQSHDSPILYYIL